LICQVHKFFWLDYLVIILVRWKNIYILIKSLSSLRSYLSGALCMGRIAPSSLLPLVFINYLPLILLRFQRSFFTLICLKLWSCGSTWWVQASGLLNWSCSLQMILRKLVLYVYCTHNILINGRMSEWIILTCIVASINVILILWELNVISSVAFWGSRSLNFISIFWLHSLIWLSHSASLTQNSLAYCIYW